MSGLFPIFRMMPQGMQSIFHPSSDKKERVKEDCGLRPGEGGKALSGPDTSRVSWTRQYPPISGVDTVVFGKKGMKSAHEGHGTAKCFLDKEIVRICPIVPDRKRLLDVSYPIQVRVDFTEGGQSVILQQAVRGCTAATAAMLIVDHHGEYPISKLRGRNLGDDTSIVCDIREAGLNPLVHDLTANLQELKRLLVENGSAIIGVDDPEIMGHSILVDSIEGDTVIIRDPWHGWQIAVTKEAFMKRFSGGKVIQIPAARVRVECLGGDLLYMRGEGGRVRSSRTGEFTVLAWDRGVRIQSGGDIEVLPLPGREVSYKVLRSDRDWEILDSNRKIITGSQTICPVFPEKPPIRENTSITAQIDVGYGNSLCLVGEGNVYIPGKGKKELSWREGIPLDPPIDGSTWNLGFELRGPISYKLVKVDGRGDIAGWEKGPVRAEDNYRLEPGSRVSREVVFL